MNDIELRVECLRLAQSQWHTTPATDIVAEAQKLYEFAKGYNTPSPVEQAA